MKKYILFILLTVMLLLPTTVVKAQYNKHPDIISVSNEKYKIKLLVFNNLENKIAKSKYRWVSSDRNIVKVNSSNGKVTAVGIGEAYVTCTITADKQVIVLRCDINVTNAEDITE